MAAYAVVAMCQQCKIAFPGPLVYEGSLQEKLGKFQNVVVATKCPECGKEVETMVDEGYWIRIR